MVNHTPLLGKFTLKAAKTKMSNPLIPISVAIFWVVLISFGGPETKAMSLSILVMA